MAYVLIVVSTAFVAGPGAAPNNVARTENVAMQEFSSKAACEDAKKYVPASGVVICLPK